EMEVIAESLPGLDCGSCGAPSCRAFAEDVARGLAVKTDCIFKLREDVRKLAEQLIDMERMQPPGLDKD
ncbi:MAG TPA: (Fe-S)-binding protein, partial [Spirochaetales bacterium]|nr:(Fe-S)-binding protein [Spirochaetales bacterium]